jgi:OOP family OmpA-OmpF porin
VNIWKKWITPCLVTSTVLTAGAVWFKKDAIEQDITNRTQAVVGGLAKVSVEGRNVTLTGTPKNDIQISSLLKKLENTDGIRQITTDFNGKNSQAIEIASNQEAEKAAEKTKLAEQEALRAAQEAAKAKDEVSKKLAEQVAQAAAQKAQLTKAIEDMTAQKASAEQQTQETLQALEEVEVAKFKVEKQNEEILLNLEKIEAEKVEVQKQAEEFRLAKEKLETEKNEAEKQAEDARLALEKFQSEISAKNEAAASSEKQNTSDNNSNTSTQPAQYYITMQKIGDALEISGVASSEALRTQLLKKINEVNPNVEIDETLIIEEPSDNKLDDTITFGLKQLDRLSEGQITIESDSLSIFGNAKSLDNYEAISDSLKDKTNADLNIAKTNIKAPKISPYLFAIDYDGNTAHLTGFIPNEEARGDVINIMKTTFPGIQVTENLQVASGEPNLFMKRVKKAASRLSLVPKGVVTLTDSEVEFNAPGVDKAELSADNKITVPTKKAEAQKTEPKKVPKVKRKFKLAENQTCQELFDQYLGQKQLEFEAGRAILTSTTLPVLKTLVRIAERCPSALLQISGHTDSDGDDALNQTLSLRRAKAVRNYLTKNGIAGSRILAIGYGEKRPIASNDTAAGKKKNRRIEFSVIEQ